MLTAQSAKTRMFNRALLTPRDHKGASRIAAATARTKATPKRRDTTLAPEPCQVASQRVPLDLESLIWLPIKAAAVKLE
jgi:hypothetical protein